MDYTGYIVRAEQDKARAAARAKGHTLAREWTQEGGCACGQCRSPRVVYRTRCETCGGEATMTVIRETENHLPSFSFAVPCK
jgi:hypothetical protein